MTTTAAPTSPSACPACEGLRRDPLNAPDSRALADHVAAADCFEIFGLPRCFDLDPDDLHCRYVDLSRNVHPDAAAGASDDVQALALRLSAAVNRAYDTLADPLRRAEYLLQTAGGATAADDKRVPPDLLADVLEKREQIEQARHAADPDALAALRSEIEGRRNKLVARIAALAARLDRSDPKLRDELRGQLNAVKYVQTLLAQL